MSTSFIKKKMGNLAETVKGASMPQDVRKMLGKMKSKLSK
jgi:hypothetical protein